MRTDKLRGETSRWISWSYSYSYLVALVQGILPTALILLLTLVVMLTVIPYAFSNVLRQMEAVRALEEADLSRHEGAETLNTNHLTNIKNSVQDL